MRQTGLPAPSAGQTQELVVWCADLDAAIARARAARTSILVEPYDHAAGHRRAYVAGPDGNWLALVQSWRGRRRQPASASTASAHQTAKVNVAPHSAAHAHLGHHVTSEIAICARLWRTSLADNE